MRTLKQLQVNLFGGPTTTTSSRLSPTRSLRPPLPTSPPHVDNYSTTLDRMTKLSSILDEQTSSPPTVSIATVTDKVSQIEYQLKTQEEHVNGRLAQIKERINAIGRVIEEDKLCQVQLQETRIQEIRLIESKFIEKIEAEVNVSNISVRSKYIFQARKETERKLMHLIDQRLSVVRADLNSESRQR